LAIHDTTSRSTLTAFDALVFSRVNQPLIAAEAKKSLGEMQRTLAEMNVLVRRPFKLRRAPRLTNSEQKARGLLALRPSFFLAVCPEESRACHVTFPGGYAIATAELIEVPLLTLGASYEPPRQHP
jgi:hypothetical protein